MESEMREMTEAISMSPWRNVYWFARMLISGDKYGAIGTKKESQVCEIANKMEALLEQPALSNEEKIKVCKAMLNSSLDNLFRGGGKGVMQVKLLYEDLDEMLVSTTDLVAFILTVQYVLTPINAAMKRVPSSDIAFCRESAKHILDTLGEESFAKVLRTWDNLGVQGCLDAERSQVVSEFTKLRTSLRVLSKTSSELDENLVLTAFVQEFERRLAQKRKSRAGTSLEDAVTFLFDYYGFSSHPKPDHFQTDIEVDKWFRCKKDGWLIGISCKRTLRERWKQVSSADSNALSRHKIKEIWNLTTYDQDLSDEKITMLGQQRQIFYLADDSERYRYAHAHIGMRDYVRPLSNLIRDIRVEQQGN